MTDRPTDQVTDQPSDPGPDGRPTTDGQSGSDSRSTGRPIVYRRAPARPRPPAPRPTVTPRVTKPVEVSSPFPVAPSPVGDQPRLSARDRHRLPVYRPVHLTLVDPQQLHGTRTTLVEQYVQAYRSSRWERTGLLVGDERASNRFPLVVTDGTGRLVIVDGHHRAAAALERGRLLPCRTLPPSSDPAVALLPRLLWGDTTTHPDAVVAHTAAIAVQRIREGHTVLCPDRVEAIVAAFTLNPTLEPSDLPLEHGEEHLVTHPQRTYGSDRWGAVEVTGGYLLCTTCGGLIADVCPTRGYGRDRCHCDPRVPEGDEYELSLPCVLCQSCRMVPVRGHHRWRFVVCGACKRRTNAVNHRFGRLVLPQGIHSMVNGGVLLSGGRAQNPEAVAAFADALTGMFGSITYWEQLSSELLIARLRRLGFEAGGTISLETYLRACEAAGLTLDDGFDELIERLALDVPPAAAELESVRDDTQRRRPRRWPTV